MKLHKRYGDSEITLLITLYHHITLNMFRKKVASLQVSVGSPAQFGHVTQTCSFALLKFRLDPPTTTLVTTL